MPCLLEKRQVALVEAGMLDVFLEGRKQEILGDEGGELLKIELRHTLGEAHEALSPVVLERPDHAVILSFLGVENDEGDEPSSQALAEHDHAPRPAVVVEEWMYALMEHAEADDAVICGAYALAVRLKEPSETAPRSNGAPKRKHMTISRIARIKRKVDRSCTPPIIAKKYPPKLACSRGLGGFTQITIL